MACGCNKKNKNKKAISSAKRRISNKRPPTVVKIKRTVTKTTTKK